MKNSLVWLVTISASIAFLLFALGFNAERQAERAYAQAAIIRAQSSARLDLATALMPYTIIGAVALMAIVALVLATMAIVRLGQPQPPRVIETRTLILLQPGQTRRDAWRQMSEIRLLEK